jgi:integrase
MATTQPIRNKQDVRDLTNYYLMRGQLRNHLLIVLGVHTALRISDLLRLRWDDVYDFERGCVRASISLTERKTGKSKTLALNKAAVKALSMLASRTAQQGRCLIENPKTKKSIGRIQAYRIIRAAADSLGIGRVSCHSLRKCLGYHAWKSGVSPAVIMEIYGHSSFAVTQRYLGITQDDMNAVYLGLEFAA